MNILVLTDNEYLYRGLKKIIQNEKFLSYKFNFFYSHTNKLFYEKYKNDKTFLKLNILEKEDEIMKSYDLVISAHCKQIFPNSLVKNNRCINIHPGYNPYNRGWFPQVFSIINKKPVGVTIHLMDEMLDHGPIIFQEEVEIDSWETSKDVYNKILKKELLLIDKYLIDILEEKYELTYCDEGNVNYIKDFNNLCELNLNEEVTMGEAIDKLKALTFEGYKNAYFIDEEGNKVWITIKLEKNSN